MASRVQKCVCQVKSDYAFQRTKFVVKQQQQHTQRKSSFQSLSQVQAQAREAMAEQEYTIPVFRERSAEEREEYQRVSTHVEKGLSVIQEELHRMRMATKAQVDSLAIDREVRSRSGP
ncbi:unnamed protein product [Tetraodon nigroviridis]|uniref:Chromosome undetermined SCAF7635, whole genome shotgun sequence n=1 Tax=Tetraodon nigroviridis TaxID=99883 RepID=Q4T966_TETNG|nr:unnamed protein product [Tetraodon nigroviridis]